MRLVARWGILLLVVSSMTCGGGGSSKKKKLPPNRARINGSLVTFNAAFHYYDSGWDMSGIWLDNSSPSGWTIDIYWDWDMDPGCPYDSCMDWLEIDVYSPWGDEYWVDYCFYDGVICMGQFAYSPGGRTVGSFYGQMENVDPPYDVLVLNNGHFDVIRQ